MAALSNRQPPSEFESAKAVFGCHYELDQRTDPKRLQTAVGKLFDSRHNKKKKNARLTVYGNWGSQPGFEGRKVDWSGLGSLLYEWKAKADFFKEVWPLSGELGLEHVWKVLRPRNEVLELLLKHNSPYKELDAAEVAKWRPFVGWQEGYVQFRPVHERYKDLKVLLHNFPTTKKTQLEKRTAVVNGLRASVVRLLSPVVKEALLEAQRVVSLEVLKHAKAHPEVSSRKNVADALGRTRSEFYEFFCKLQGQLEELAERVLPVSLVT